MAVDTRAKRSSAMNFGVWDLTLPEADSAVGQADRQQLCGMYGGILASQVPTIPGMEFTLPTNRMHFDLDPNLLHYDLPANRLHFTAPEDD